MLRGEIRLYNIILPIWFIMFASWFFNPLLGALITLGVLAVNFGIDTGVLFLGMKCLDIDGGKGLYRRRIWQIWAFGFVGDICGNALLFATQFFSSQLWDGWLYTNIIGPVSSNPFKSVWSFLYVLAAIAVAAVIIYVLDRFVCFRQLEDRKKAHRLALVMAIATAPYAFLIPTEWFY